jgi:hypothetical protein
VQVFDSGLSMTLRTERKLQAMWLGPHRVSERILNSYKLETLEGTPLEGEFNARRLRPFEPRAGTELAAQQEAFMEKLREVREEGQEESIEAEADEQAPEQEEQWTPEEEEEEEEEDTGEGDVVSLGIAQRVSAR